MSDPVQLEEKSGKSKTSKQSKKSSVKQQSNEASEKNSKNNKEEIKNSENNEYKKEAATPQQVLSTRAYLEQNVTPVVQEALLEVAKKRPENPLEFVGNYILNRAKGK